MDRAQEHSAGETGQRDDTIGDDSPFEGRWIDEYRLIRRIWAGCFPSSATQAPLTPLERSFMTCLVFTRSLSLLHIARVLCKCMSGSVISELYVVVWFVLVLSLWILHDWVTVWVAIALVAYRLVDGLNYRLCIVFVDRYKQGWGLRSLNRSLILLFINYLEIVFGFAVLYLGTASIGNRGIPVAGRLNALYFSVVTVTTLGYGDMTPLDATGRILTATETIVGFVLVVLVMGSFLTGVRDIHNLPQDPP